MTRTSTLERPQVAVERVVERPVRVKHRKAKKTMIGVITLCALVGLLPGAQQLAVHGWRAFISRPDGVGASEEAAAGPGSEAAEPQASAPPQTGAARSP